MMIIIIMIIVMIILVYLAGKGSRTLTREICSTIAT